MHTLIFDATTLELPEHLLWADEFDWPPVAQGSNYTLTGALYVDAAAKQAGRFITLQGGQRFGWMARSQVLALQAWRDVPGRVMQLSVRGATAVPVIFDHARGAIEARPVVDYSDPVAADHYVVTLRFITL